MPYRQVKKKGTRTVTKYRDVIKQDRLGYTEIEVHRPKIIYFEFQGMRPNIPHWIFFGNTNVTKYCNTSYTEEDWKLASRTSAYKEPGDRYVNATGFPTELGGPTNGGGNGALTSNADGSLSGFFYLQSNAVTNFKTQTDGTNFSALDVSVMDRQEALSYASTKFYGMGQYENWYQYTVEEKKDFTEQYTYYESVYYEEDDNNNDNYTSGTVVGTWKGSVGRSNPNDYVTSSYSGTSNSFKGSYDADGWGE